MPCAALDPTSPVARQHHNSGDVEVWSGTYASGQEGCISAASYYDNLANNYYPNGKNTSGNIGSNYCESSDVC